MTTEQKTMQNDRMAAARAAKGKRIRANNSDFAYAFTPKAGANAQSHIRGRPK